MRPVFLVNRGITGQQPLKPPKAPKVEPISVFKQKEPQPHSSPAVGTKDSRVFRQPCGSDDVT